MMTNDAVRANRVFIYSSNDKKRLLINGNILLA